MIQVTPMRKAVGVIGLSLFSVLAIRVGVGAQTSASPAWAYGVSPSDPVQTPPPQNPGGAAPRPPDTSLKRIPGSSKEFTLAHIRDYWDVGDWFPEDHPPMPSVVVHGRQPHVRGCAMCHMPNGKGRPENAPIAGQSYAYVLQQLTDFKNGLRASADPRKLNTVQMIEAAKDMTDDEMKAAAEYFSSMKWTPWITRRRGRRRAEDAARRQRVHASTRRWHRTHRQSHRRVTGECRALRASRSALGLHRLRSARQPSEGRRARRERRWQDDAMRRLSRADLNGLGPVPAIAGRSPSYSCASCTTCSRAPARARGRR